MEALKQMIKRELDDIVYNLERAMELNRRLCTNEDTFKSILKTLGEETKKKISDTIDRYIKLLDELRTEYFNKIENLIAFKEKEGEKTIKEEELKDIIQKFIDLLKSFKNIEKLKEKVEIIKVIIDRKTVTIDDIEKFTGLSKTAIGGHIGTLNREAKRILGKPLVEIKYDDKLKTKVYKWLLNEDETRALLEAIKILNIV